MKKKAVLVVVVVGVAISVVLFLTRGDSKLSVESQIENQNNITFSLLAPADIYSTQPEFRSTVITDGVVAYTHATESSNYRIIQYEKDPNFNGNRTCYQTFNGVDEFLAENCEKLDETGLAGDTYYTSLSGSGYRLIFRDLEDSKILIAAFAMTKEAALEIASTLTPISPEQAQDYGIYYTQ